MIFLMLVISNHYVVFLTIIMDAKIGQVNVRILMDTTLLVKQKMAALIDINTLSVNQLLQEIAVVVVILMIFPINVKLLVGALIQHLVMIAKLLLFTLMTVLFLIVLKVLVMLRKDVLMIQKILYVL